MYPLRRPDGQMFALRVFRTPGKDLVDRYDAANCYLTQHRLPALVECRYLKCAVASVETSDPVPAVLMDWVRGVRLDAWLAEQCDSASAGNSDAAKHLNSMANRWHELTKTLLERGVVHGDLEPGNIMVEPAGHLRLVDYDNFCPPALLGQPTPHVGTLPYQHPDRDARTAAFAGLDNFAALTIYVLLRALSADPTLWRLRSGDNEHSAFLFREESIDAAVNHSLLQAVLTSPDEEVGDLAHYLQQLSQGELCDVPAIDEVLLWCNSVESLLSRGDFDRATELVSRMGPTECIDSALLSKIENAWQRVECHRALETALDTGDIRAIQNEYRQELLADYPAAARLAEQARRRLDAAAHLAEIASAREENRWLDFAQLWQQHGPELADVRAADEYASLYKAIERVQALENLLNDPASDPAQVDRSWQALFASGEPPLADRLYSARARRAARSKLLRRIDALLQKTSRAPTFDDDRQLRCLWKQAKELGETRLESQKAHYRLARLRIKRVRWLNDQAKTPTLAGEQHVAACLRYLPPNYHPNLPRRIQLARQRLSRIRKLEMALLEPISERALLRAWRAVASVRGEELVPDSWRERVELAQRRAELIEQLGALSRLPADERDQQVLSIWDESLLSGCPNAISVRALRDQADRRVATLAELQRALDANDAALVQRLLSAPELTDYRFSSELQGRIELHRNQMAEARQARRHRLVQSVLDHDPKRFRELFDRELVAELCAQVPQHQPLVSRWLEREILPLGKCGLRAIEPGLRQLDERRWRAKWQSPAVTIADHTLLTISRDRPKPHAVPCDLELLHAAEVVPPAGEVEAVAVEFTIEPAWRGAHAFAWAAIDLGFQTFYSEPLFVGQLRPPDG